MLSLAMATTLFTGCIRQYAVTMGDQPPNQSHYVIIQATMNGNMKLYDCRSSADGVTWDPACVKVELRNTVVDPKDVARAEREAKEAAKEAEKAANP